MTLGSHQTSIGKSQVHITPRRILEPLGTFDLDPCASLPRPWECARVNLTEDDDGLSQDWFGRVWLNPPFDRRTINDWLGRMAMHGRGIALTHARTDTAWFFGNVWERASALLFLRGRVVFHKPGGSQQTTSAGKVANSGAPVVLCAYGMQDMDILGDCGLEGHFVPLRLPRCLIVAIFDQTWSQVLKDVLTKQSGPLALQDLYRLISNHPKTKSNNHWRAKVRQTLNRSGFKRCGKGVWAYGE